MQKWSVNPGQGRLKQSLEIEIRWNRERRNSKAIDSNLDSNKNSTYELQYGDLNWIKDD